MKPPGGSVSTVETVSAVTAFATGTSFGTMGILVPTVAFCLSRCRTTRPSLCQVERFSRHIGRSLLAHFGHHGALKFGTGCDHIEHVRTQLPYAWSADYSVFLAACRSCLASLLRFVPRIDVLGLCSVVGRGCLKGLLWTSLRRHLGAHRPLSGAALHCPGRHAAVYEAEEPNGGRRVAVKLLIHRGLARPRFARVPSAHSWTIPTSCAVSIWDARGQSVPQQSWSRVPVRVFREHRPPGSRKRTQEVVRVIADLADACEYLHDRAIVHRDLKSSILVLPTDEPAAGFGTARSLSGRVHHAARRIRWHFCLCFPRADHRCSCRRSVRSLLVGGAALPPIDREEAL